ncbi:uncharacterized protein LOC143463427 [Clavelina lepadiformis]|uniref:Uncharacterized protein n=1 Tax=Clavelina lepadiformis TaxID=159417 RepID=A0ABP0FNQ2_CLALP
MKVIVAGYSKTGTKSMVVALNQLGYNVYDFFDHFWYHGDKWEKIFSSSGGSIDDFKEMYQSVDAVTDCPPNIFWEEILQAFPDAKVILTTRDEDKWYPSLLKQTEAFRENYVYNLMQIISPTGRRYFTFMRNTVMGLWGLYMRHPIDFSTSRNQMIVKKSFRQHGQYCAKNCPPDKLLVYDVRQGWAPLCEFLGKEIPDKPFPHENVAGNVVAEMMAKHPALIRMQRETGAIVFLLSVGLIFGSYKLYKSKFGGAFLCKLYSRFNFA